MDGGPLIDIINVQLIGAGFGGAVIRSLGLRKLTALKAMGYLISGPIAANLLVPYLLRILTPTPALSVFVGFFVGYGSFEVCRFLFKKFMETVEKTK